MRRLILLLSLWLMFLGGPAWAAVTANSAITPQTPKLGLVQFLQGTDVAGTYKTVYTAGANGSICNAVWMNNNDPSATHVVTVQIFRATVAYGGTSLLSVVNAGYVNATSPQNLLATWLGLPLDANGNPYIYLAPADTLQATFATALTATDWINVGANCADY